MQIGREACNGGCSIDFLECRKARAALQRTRYRAMLSARRRLSPRELAVLSQKLRLAISDRLARSRVVKDSDGRYVQDSFS
jgi:hypothetical protein